MDINMLRRALWVILKPLLVLITNLINPEIGEEWLTQLNKFNRKEPCWVAVVETVTKAKVYLRRLFEGLPIGATDGTATFKNSGFVIGYVDPNYKPTVEARPAVNASVWEMILDGIFALLFGSLGENRGRWTEAQVVAFCRDHPDKLRTGGYGTFFELEGGFVAVVRVLVGGRLEVYVRPFSRDYVWRAKYRHRLVSPQ